MAYREAVHSGNQGWEWSSAAPLYRLTGRTLGIVGLGRIGTAVALRAKAFGMRVAATYETGLTDTIGHWLEVPSGFDHEAVAASVAQLAGAPLESLGTRQC